MQTPALHPREAARLEALRRLDVLYTEDEVAFDDLTFLASTLYQAPIALVSLVSEHRQWFKSCRGLAERETDRDVSFCGHTILDESRALVVPDASLDLRFADNPYVLGAPHLRFYAGVSIHVEGLPVGTLCVADSAPRLADATDVEPLVALGRRAEALLSARMIHRQLLETQATLERLGEVLSMCASCKSVREDGRWVSLEAYVRERHHTAVSHGLCPTCEVRHFPEVL